MADGSEALYGGRGVSKDMVVAVLSACPIEGSGGLLVENNCVYCLY